MGLCLESGKAKTAPAPKILQLLLAPMKTAGVWYHCTQRHCSCVSIWVWFLKMLNVKVPSRLHGCFCSIAAFQKKSREGVNSLHVVFFPVVQAGRTVAWEWKRAFQWGGGNWQQEPRQLSGTHLPPAPILHLSASAVKVAVWPCN